MSLLLRALMKRYQAPTGGEGDDLPGGADYPAHLSTSKVGKNYTGRSTQFVTTKWRVNGLARKNSPSLDKALQALEQFSPTIVK